MCFKPLAGLTAIATIATLALASLPVMAAEAWQVLVSEQGKRVEIDRESIVSSPAEAATARGRIVLDRPIVDPKTSVSYRIIEISNRFNCTERTVATLKRSYYKEEGDLLRQEEVRGPFDLPVRSGTPDYRLFREVCRPKSGSNAVSAANITAEKVSEAAGELRKMNEALIEKEVMKEANKDLQPASSPASSLSPVKRRADSRNEKPLQAVLPTHLAWAYEGQAGPDNWGKLKSDYATCAAGRRQSPIDIRDGIAVDLDPIQFTYRPAMFRVADSGRNVQVVVYGGSFSLLGKNYELTRIQFHRPAEMTVDGKTFAMDAQIEHRSTDGQVAIVVVLLEPGEENPVVQMALNHLPLEKGSQLAPPTQSIDVARLLPENQRYFTFMGSLTTPPCSEDVLWLVLKQPQKVSAEQLAIFQRLYKPNARPLQPAFGRLIKESR